MQKLKKKLRHLDRRLARNQKWRHKALGLRKKFREHNRKALAGIMHKVSERLHSEIKDIEAEIKKIEKQIEALEEQGKKGREAYLKWLESTVGMTEDDPRRQAMANELGGGALSWPWCSEHAAYGLWKHGGFERNELPSNPWYSGAWLTWAHGTRVSWADRQPGDLLIFDWGDGGMTDHVATYVGNGLKIGGNENDRVEKDAVPVSNVVGVVRPNW